MKVNCDRAALLEAVNLVSAVVAARSPKPQLLCVKLEAAAEGDAGELALAATDAEASIRLSTAHVEVAAPGAALVPADKLRQIVAAEDADDTLTIETDDDAVHIRGADAKFTVYGYPPGDFPPPPDFAAAAESASAVLTVAAGELASLIARTLFATARETSRYAINGVLFRREGKKLEMVATDGRRLALARGAIEHAEGDETAQRIIPSKALNLALRLVADADEPVRVALTDNQAVFAFGEAGQPPRATLSTALVEGAFPPYGDVIPKDQDKKATFDVSKLTSAVKRAALLTNEESRGVRLSLDGAAMRLSSRAPEMGEAEINVDVEDYAGDPIEIGFNPQFITDALKVVSEPQVVIELKAPNKPGVLKAGSEFTYVVMPVNLQ